MNEIMNNLKHSGSFYKFKGIISCVNSNGISTEIIDSLKALKNDNSRIAGYKISDFCMAALDIMNIEKYKGNDDIIIKLIKSKFEFACK